MTIKNLQLRYLIFSGCRMDDPVSKTVRKHNQRSKYNKLTEDQKLEIIKYWGEKRESIASLTQLYSNKWGMNLSYRGIAEIIKHWKENGKIRGSKLLPSCHDIIPELYNIDRVASCCHINLSEGELRMYLQCMFFLWKLIIRYLKDASAAIRGIRTGLSADYLFPNRIQKICKSSSPLSIYSFHP